MQPCWSTTAACCKNRPTRPPTKSASCPCMNRCCCANRRNMIFAAPPWTSLWNWAISPAPTTIWKSSSLTVRTTANWPTSLGQCQEALGRPEKAAASYREAVAHAPDRIDVYSRLARLLRGPLGQPTDADQVMDDLVAANDHNATAYSGTSRLPHRQRLSGGRRERRRPRPRTGAGRRPGHPDDGRPRRSLGP